MRDAAHHTQSTEDAAGAAPPQELLLAGAVLPLGTPDAGERGTKLTARSYTHPGLEGRTVVRLAGAELGSAEDAAAGFLGLEPSAEPAVVGIGLRQALGFPEWVFVNHPEDGHHALAVIPKLDQLTRQAKSRARPKRILNAYQELANRLAEAVPHFLPTFYEHAGRVFLEVEDAADAARMFSRARAAEAEFGLRIDEDRLDAVFLEFALAGAVPVKALTDYGRGLAARLPAAEALERFARLCLRRTVGGMPPTAQMATELHKLAKAAGSDGDAVEQRCVAELVSMPATLLAPASWWKTHLPALAAAARQDASVRRPLLDVMPACQDHKLAETWLSVLLETGAAEALYDPAQQGPADGTLGWLRRFQQLRGRWTYKVARLPELYPLVEKCAPRLRAELAQETATPPAGSWYGNVPRAVPGRFTISEDIDLLDLLLALDVPVADPDKGLILRLDFWSEGEGQRDLAALAADPRFRSAFHEWFARFGNSFDGAVSILSASPGGRVMLRDSTVAIARSLAAAGLPDLPDAVERLSWLPGEALALADKEMRAALQIAPVLARTLHAGLFDELGWPEWDKAVAELPSSKAPRGVSVVNAWPYLIVSSGTQVRVLGAEGTVLTHELRIPPGDGRDPGLCYVDGELLVYWKSSADRALRGYWHRTADQVQPITSHATRYGHSENTYFNTTMSDNNALPASSLPLPDGGRTTGSGAPIHRGDTVVPRDRHLLSDGASFWVHADENGDRSFGWREFDPRTGTVGRASVPDFVSAALRAAPAGSKASDIVLLPAPTAEAGPAARPVNGLYGWCVVRLPDGSMRGHDLSGLTASVPSRADRPVRVLTFPDAERASALTRSHYTLALVDPDGIVTSTARTDGQPTDFAGGTPLLPPVEFWHFMRPRDPEGSAALRRIDDDLAAALLDGLGKGASSDETRALVAARVRAVLPQVTDKALIAGIAGVVQRAANQQVALDAVAQRLDDALSAQPQPQAPEPGGPVDALLLEPLRSLGADRPESWIDPHESAKNAMLQELRLMSQTPRSDGTFQQVRLIGQARRDPAEPFPPGTLQLEGTELPSPATGWWGVLLNAWSALAYRAASPVNTPEMAPALHTLLQEFDAAGLAVATATSPWRLVKLRLWEKTANMYGKRLEGAWRRILPLADGAFLAFVDRRGYYKIGYYGYEFTALHHDPTGRFAMPASYEATLVDAVGEQRPEGWLAAFLAEYAELGPVPWFPRAAPRFAELTGATPTQAALIVAGLPNWVLPSDICKLIGVKASDAATAVDMLNRLHPETLRRVVAALAPDDPALLWTQGPDVDAAAEAWNRLAGRRISAPEALLVEARQAVASSWRADFALPALLNPATSDRLSKDLPSAVGGSQGIPLSRRPVGFDEDALTGAVATAAWAAHRLPAGDPLRASLPAALEAVRARLAFPELVLSLGSYVSLPAFRKAAGVPTEVAKRYERYGAVLMPTHKNDDHPTPAVKVALLDETGDDPYLPALGRKTQDPFPVIAALRVARDPAFARLMADPGDPAAGERDKDGTWAPQDPSRSVPELVVEAAGKYGLGEDAAALYLMLLAMPDPTDRNTVRWTGWKAPRMAAARTELAATDLVVEATRTRAKRSLFLPGAWAEQPSPHLPLERWKLPLLGALAGTEGPLLGVLVPAAPAAEVYREAWRRVREDDGPRFQELKVRTVRGRRR